MLNWTKTKCTTAIAYAPRIDGRCFFTPNTSPGCHSRPRPTPVSYLLCMVAKIGRGTQLYGALRYNLVKVEQEQGQILLLHRMADTPDGRCSVPHLTATFAPYLAANRRTEKPVLHISLNPDPRDRVDDETFCNIAQDYMTQMGYGDQPFAVFKHEDIERTHIHIVTTCVDADGRKINDKFEYRRSMDACRRLEQKYGLHNSTEKEQNKNRQLFRPVDYAKGNVKSQIASVVRYLPKQYRFQSLGAYNALLSLFNIAASEVEGELQGQHKRGLVYSALDKTREKIGPPFKASLFGKQAGINELEKHFARCREELKAHPAKGSLKNTVETAMHLTAGETEFKGYLHDRGISTVTRRNAEGRLYGITFIDHAGRTVWNGSQLDKKLSANAFNEKWNAQSEQKVVQAAAQADTGFSHAAREEENGTVHQLFDFLDAGLHGQDTDNFYHLGAMFSLLPETLPEDYEEQLFAKRMRKKKKNRQRPKGN